MAGEKRERQKMNRQARIAAEEEARRAAARKRQSITIAVIMVVVVGGLAFFKFVAGGDDKKNVVAGATSTTVAGTPTTVAPGSTVAPKSAAGKPCVARTSPLPAGAPEVDVVVGAPPTELLKKDIKTGDGPVVEPGATVKARYIGISCSTGAIFDSSYSRGTDPIEFPLTGVIKGWTDGIPGMKVGGQRLLGIPAEQAYGASPRAGSGIAPDEPLWFVVEIVGVS